MILDDGLEPEPRADDGANGAERDPGAPAVRFAMPTVPDAPPPEWRYRRAFALPTAWRALWRSRPIVWGLVVRQLRSQYSQQVLGLAWAVVTPLAQMLVFTIVLGNIGGKTKISFEGLPKPLFLYVGLAAWSFYSSGVSSGGTSLVGNPLLNKVYAPREVFPISQVASSGIDAAIGVAILPLLCLATRHGVSATIGLALIPAAILIVFTTAIALVVSAMTVYARDLRSGLPIVLQLGLFMPGIVYSVSVLHPVVRDIYTAIFPVGVLIEQIRGAVLLHHAPGGILLVIATISSFVYLLLGFVYFKRLETGFADVS